MKKIEILGPGCAKCEKLRERTDAAASQIGLDCKITKVSDMQQILSYGVVMTPALVVDGVVKVTGRVPSDDELKEMLS
ncbi:MAG: thioredoxin family protein [Candidatus Zixiibacteriota bacterium]|nr:MAG: thioredoxin family protein [candidate division Zixibacteria bacterium]